MEKRIGILLDVTPKSGGTFQYAISVLRAVGSLENEYQIYAVYLDACWEPYLDEFRKIERHKVKYTKGDLVVLNYWRRNKLLTYFVRFVVPYFTSFGVLANRIRPNLWVFPCQDSWAYDINTKSLTSVLDLMHRYEPRFTELSRKDIYDKRETRYKNICEYSAGILVDSVLGEKQLEESYRVKGQTFVLPYIPIERPENNNKSLAKLKLPKKYAFYPAQFWPHKNHSGLIKAIKVLKDKGVFVNLVLTGYPHKEYETVKNLVRVSGLEKQVFFIHQVSEDLMMGLYKQALMLVMPDFCGPTNIPPLEAIKYGVPPAVARVYAVPDQLQDAAVYFDPNSEIEIADAIERLWTDKKLRKKLIDNGKVLMTELNQNTFNKRFRNIVETLI